MMPEEDFLRSMGLNFSSVRSEIENAARRNGYDQVDLSHVRQVPLRQLKWDILKDRRMKLPGKILHAGREVAMNLLRQSCAAEMYPDRIYHDNSAVGRLGAPAASRRGLVAHEAAHLAYYQAFPDIMDRVPKTRKGRRIERALREGFAHYIADEVVSDHPLGANYGPRKKRYLEHSNGPHGTGYRFFRDVCEAGCRGPGFAFRVLENPPQSMGELREPYTYVMRAFPDGVYEKPKAVCHQNV